MFKKLLIVAALFIVSIQSIAATTELLTVTSQHSAEPVEFTVTLPAGYKEATDKRYVVLFDFHPASQQYLAGMHHWMSHNSGWPWLETIVVTAPNGHEGLGKLKEAAIETRDGKALLDLLEHDLLAAVDKKYRTNGFRIFNGFTGNAGLVLYTLINRPSLFNAYFAASPVLSRDFAYVIADAPKKLAALTGKPRFLFMSTSDSDFEQRQLAPFAELETIIKANASPTLDYHIKRFDGTYYMTQPILATAYGIELVFDDVHTVLAPDSTISSQGSQAILDHYQHLSQQKYGFEVQATDSLIALAKSQASSDQDAALATYQFTVKSYPNSATAHDALAAAYSESGEIALAIKHQQLALDNTDHPFWLNKYTKSLAALEAKKLL